MSSQKFDLKSHISAIAICISAICMTPFWSFEPIHLPRLLLASILVSIILPVVISKILEISKKPLLSNAHLKLIMLASLFLISLVLTLFFSESNIQRQIFGTQGRLNGVLTNTLLVVFLMGVAFSSIPQNLKLWDTMFLIGGGVNVAYGYLQAFGKDFIAWQNPFGPVIGTFGNSNFMSSFLALFGIYLVTVILLRNDVKIFGKYCYMGLLLITVNLIRETQSIQGFFVLLVGAILAFAMRMRGDKYEKILGLGVLLACTLSIFLVLGLAGRGIFGSLLYQSTLKVRTYYWQTALTMLEQRPFFGFGLDTFGDWYRSLRPEEQVQAYGPNLVTNSAHNIFLDFAAFGGIPLFVTYTLLVTFITLKATIKLKRDPEITWLFGLFYCGWIGYLLQALISIQHLGLSIWGMVFGGGIYAMSTETQARIEYRSRNILSKWLTAVCALAFVLSAWIPFKKDLEFQNALAMNDGSRIVEVAKKFPQNDFYLILAADIMYQNTYEEIGRDLTNSAIKINPRNYAAYSLLVRDSTVSEIERLEYTRKLRELDPFQPD